MLYKSVSRQSPLASLRREVRLRRHRQSLLLYVHLPDPSDPLTKYSDCHFEELFRLTKASFRELLTIIQGDLDRWDNRGRPLPPPYQLLLALHFYATGSLQKEIGERHGLAVSQPTVCRTIQRVSEALARRYEEFVVFPSISEAPDIHARFYATSHFPNIIGAIACTHIRISNPGGAMAEQCRNTQGWHSLKCQVVVGPDLRILTATTRFGGSVPSHLIYERSGLRRVLEQGEYGHLVGGRGYQCTRYLLTPIPSPSTQGERRYNHAHAAICHRVQSAIGLVQRRFQCMARELRSNPKTSCAVILSCFALHNFLLQRQGPGEVSEGPCAPDDGPQERFAGESESDAEGESYRCHVLHEWFSDEAEDQETHLGPSESVVSPNLP
ncbi:putative nuclease HARBI1 [Eriocheir sinensis]|uniref:putative nuclease HARBI1 n=1 Tax=Eriocheir sinensis TaxID=95602 RepID=UPI0021C60559|nr:putative nuclease HARBI1 [Eriocheir sinensis]XP_050713667.1 putative nuclease HARBI1 [Eriocheir sinensis]